MFFSLHILVIVRIHIKFQQTLKNVLSLPKHDIITTQTQNLKKNKATVINHVLCTCAVNK